MKRTTNKKRYRFHVVDVDAMMREKEAYAERVTSGAYSSDTYKDRLASERAKEPKTSRSEIRRNKEFLRKWKRQRKGYLCTHPGCRHLFPKPNTRCYWHTPSKERQARLNEYRKQSLAPIVIPKRRQRRGELEETNALLI